MMGAAYTADRYFYPRPPRGGRPLADLGCTITSEFLSTPSARRATASRSSSTRTSTFLSTPSARRATNYLAGPIGDFLISIHALREEGDLRLDQVLDLAAEFLSTPSARRATCRQHRHRGDSRYFYPRPPRGGRRLSCPNPIQPRYFYPRPPRGGRLSPRLLTVTRVGNFYPRPPRGGRHIRAAEVARIIAISIHALREEGDMASLSHRLFRGRISIHALREEGDWIWCASWGLFLQFLSTPSARRATAGRRNVRRLVGVFLSTPSARRATISR